MGKNVRAKKSRSPLAGRLSPLGDIPYFKQIDVLIPTIGASFLRERITTYAESAHELIEALNQPQQNEFLQDALHYYGKQARTLDLVLAVAGASGYLPAADKTVAQKIRLSVENEIGRYAPQPALGQLQIAGPTGSWTESTHSAFGRRVAALFAKIVPPAEGAAEGMLLHDSILPAQTHDQLAHDLTAAKAHHGAGRWREAEQTYQAILKTHRKNG